MPFQTPVWRDCVCAGSPWRDASRLYELPEDRANIKSRFGGQAFPLAGHYYERIPLSLARTAFQAARKNTEEFVLARTSRR
jgi:hypothetical protein